MPMKCIDQMPMPIASEPPASQSMALRPLLRVIRSDKAEGGVGGDHRHQDGERDQRQIVLSVHARAI